ncbi:hypothetical protein GCM10010191_67500 [Actinomadura vinacea]|uniref:YbaB/EbfC family DNA-binding protein n=1 Tax=Actinomadura vinacea TaxID=115336 RepID=A0ABP5X0K3_9ACTN
MADFSSGELDRMLSEARKALESMRQGDTAGPPPEPVEAVGESADGRVTVTATTGGRITGVEINPRAMRLSSQELGEQMVIAINAALDELRAKAPTAESEPAVDPAALQTQLEELQNQGVRQMEMIRHAIGDTLARLEGGR